MKFTWWEGSVPFPSYGFVDHHLSKERKQVFTFKNLPLSHWRDFDQNAAFKCGFLIGSEHLMCPIPPKMCLADVWGERSEQTRCHQTHRIIRHFDRWTDGGGGAWVWQSVIFHNQSARSAADSPNFLFNYFPQDKSRRDREKKKKKKQLKLSLCFSLSESITDQLINNWKVASDFLSVAHWLRPQAHQNCLASSFQPAAETWFFFIEYYW